MVVGRFAFTERGQMRKRGTRTSPESVGSRGGTSTGHGGGSSNMGWAHVNGSRSLHHRRLRRKPSRSSTEPRSAPLRRNRRTPTYGLTVRESPRRSAVSVRETLAVYPLLPTTVLSRPSPFARNHRTFAPHQSKRFSFFRSFSTFGSPFSNPRPANTGGDYEAHRLSLYSPSTSTLRGLMHHHHHHHHRHHHRHCHRHRYFTRFARNLSEDRIDSNETSARLGFSFRFDG